MSTFLQTMTDTHTGPAVWKLANAMASSQLIPPHLRGKVEDVFVALAMAEQLGENPVVVMQNIYVVSGRAGWNASYMIARANKSGVFKGRISWHVEGKGDALTVTAFATLADSGEVVSMSCDMAMANAEGWTKNPKYRTMPEVMLRYRSATLLIRMYAADVMLGMHTSDELETIVGGVEVTQPPRGARAAVLGALTDGPPAGTVAPMAMEEEREVVTVAANWRDLAVTNLKKHGISMLDAIAKCGGRGVNDWTDDDRATLRAMVEAARATEGGAK